MWYDAKSWVRPSKVSSSVTVPAAPTSGVVGSTSTIEPSAGSGDRVAPRGWGLLPDAQPRELDVPGFPVDDRGVAFMAVSLVVSHQRLACLVGRAVAQLLI